MKYDRDRLMVNGQEYTLQDIERAIAQVALNHPAINAERCALFTILIDGQQRPVCAVEVASDGGLCTRQVGAGDHGARVASAAHEIDGVAIGQAIREKLATLHGLELHDVLLLQPAAIPTNSYGAVWQAACERAYLNGSLVACDGQPVQPLTSENVRAWLREQVATLQHIDPGLIKGDEPFANYGLRPRQLITRLELWRKRRFAPTLLYDYPTIDLLAAYLVPSDQPRPQVSQPPRQPHEQDEPIAIIGIGCRFPGGANSPAAFWQLLRDGVDTISEMPAERWDVEERYHADRAIPGAVVTRWGGFLDAIDQFDSGFFGISPREAACMDPQQRILLEVAWEALEDAGLPADRLAGSQTGVFIGSWLSDYGQAQLGMLDQIDNYVGTGSVLGLLANRLSYAFDLHGPSMVTDTACSSSLVALHMACQSLRTGESSLVLAGGSNLLLSPAFTINFSKARVLSPDGRCKTFDARADGYVRSEGADLVVLKPLSRALADGDRVYAVIRGGVVQQDGLTNGIMSPNRHAQETMLQMACERAGIAPWQVDYIEAHGTGTFLGDPIETTALGAVLGAERASDIPCLIGSVKTNIGHLEGAAGIAGLIKAALMLHHRELVPSLHFETPNPLIPFEELKLEVVQQHRPWPSREHPRIAGVSSFGFGGTIAHMVLEEAPPADGSATPADNAEAHVYLLPLSAKSAPALAALAAAYADFLATSTASLADICSTASVRRTHHPYRLAVTGRAREELIQALQQRAPTPTPVRERTPRLVCVFPGQGSQWAGMGQQLLQAEPVFRAAILQCAEAFRPYVDWSLLEVLEAAPEQQALQRIDIIQPTLFAMQVGLAALWHAWGVRPDAVIGHSMGEVAAAYVAGALSLDDAARIICQRSQLLRRISGQGAMAMVGLSAEAAHTAINGRAAHVSVAVCNSPTTTVLSGDPVQLEQVLAELAATQIFVRKVQVDVASHSPQVEPLQADLVAALHPLQPQAATVAFYSTVTGARLEGTALDATYWWENLRQPVQFAQTVQQACADGHTLFVEVSAHPILGVALQETLECAGAQGQSFASLRRDADERQALLTTLGALYTSGYAVDWTRLYATGACVTLPAYPWQRQRYWLEGAATPLGLPAACGRSSAVRTAGHPLLPTPLTPCDHPEQHYWSFTLAHGQPLRVEEHQVHGVPTLPAAAYVDLALAAVQSLLPDAPGVSLHDLTLHQALTVPTHTAQAVQLTLVEAEDGTFVFRMHSQPGAQQPGVTVDWVQHDQARLQRMPSAPEQTHVDSAAIQARCPEAMDSTTHYDQMQARGLTYGPGYRSVQQLWRGDGEALAHLVLPAEARQHQGFVFHPALLDGGLQLLLAALPPTTDTYLPVGIGSLRLDATINEEMWVWARVVAPEASSERLVGSLTFFDSQGTVLAAVLDVQLQAFGTTAARPDAISEWCYARQWEMQALPTPTGPQDGVGGWLICADRGGVGAALAAHLASTQCPCVLLFADEVLGRPLAEQRASLAATLRQQATWQGIIHLWSLDAVATADLTLDALNRAQARGCGSVLTLVQVLIQQAERSAPRLWLVTAGAQAVTETDRTLAIAQAPLWGLGQVILYEHATLRCGRVDLSATPTDAEIAALAAECQVSSQEDQVALRAGQRYVCRLNHWSPSMDDAAVLPATRPLLQRPTTPAGMQPFSLVVPRPGILESMTLRPLTRRMPGAGEVEIEVIAAGLNFRDVLLALNALQGEQEDASATLLPGLECAGRVVAVGEGVSHFRPGQAVIALAQHSFGSFVTTPQILVAPMPKHVTFEEAATIPIAFLTAFYALYEVGRLKKGERVLIHAASGGVGLAAVQLAQLVGAEIFATAGSPEKRAFLQELGIPHVLDSRSLDFADEIRHITNGEGVDVVLNSLGGDFIDHSFNVLRNYGRFIELGKRDYLANRKLGLQPFLRNLSFSLVDLWGMLQQRPELIQKLFQGVMGLFERRACEPLPQQVCALEEAYDAFRAMAQARHIGKLVLSIGSTAMSYGSDNDPYRTTVERGVTTAHHAAVRTDVTYLITGGTGGLGLVVARWLVEQGARHLALVSRRGASDEVRQAIDDLQALGARVVVYRADVAQPEDVALVLQSIAATMPPLRGVFHTAGVLEDALLTRMTHKQLARVLAPKVAGAWNLHRLTQNQPLELFVLFSSVVALLGSPGQGNYAAANAFLDSLAHMRRAQGLPALSINWGPWSEVGMAAAQANRGERLAGRGMESLTPEQGIAALAQLLMHAVPQVGVVRLNVRQWRQFYPTFAASPLLEQLAAAQRQAHAVASDAAGMRNVLKATAPTERRAVLIAYLRAQVGQVLRQSPDQVEVQRPFTTMGIDSLMTLELRNRLESGLSVTLSATLVWSYPTVEALTDHLAGKLGLVLEEPRQTEETTHQTALDTPFMASLDGLSEEELEALLCEELGDL